VSFRLCRFESTVVSCQNHCRAEANDRRHQPGAPFGPHAATQRFNGSLRQALFLERVVKLSFQLHLWLSLPKLRPDPGSKFHRLKGKGDDVISAQVQCAGPLQRTPVNDHHNLERSRIRPRLDLADQAATAEVGGRCLGNQDSRGKTENFVH